MPRDVIESLPAIAGCEWQVSTIGARGPWDGLRSIRAAMHPEFPGLAVHRSIGSCEYLYTVSHVASGCRVVVFDTMGALGVALAALAAGGDWTASAEEIQADTVLRARLHEASLKAYRILGVTLAKVGNGSVSAGALGASR